MTVLSELLATQAAEIAGPKGKHIEGRTHHHWGTATTPIGFGGRQVSLSYPRVRARVKGAGREVTLPGIEMLREGDPMTARVAEQIALGVSTGGYERSLELVDESIETRGTSKSNASRALIDATTEKIIASFHANSTISVSSRFSSTALSSRDTRCSSRLAPRPTAPRRRSASGQGQPRTPRWRRHWCRI